jgi:hypothetical protein
VQDILARGDVECARERVEFAGDGDEGGVHGEFIGFVLIGGVNGSLEAKDEG